MRKTKYSQKKSMPVSKANPNKRKFIEISRDVNKILADENLDDIKISKLYQYKYKHADNVKEMIFDNHALFVKPDLTQFNFFSLQELILIHLEGKKMKEYLLGLPRVNYKYTIHDSIATKTIDYTILKEPLNDDLLDSITWNTDKDLRAKLLKINTTFEIGNLAPIYELHYLIEAIISKMSKLNKEHIKSPKVLQIMTRLESCTVDNLLDIVRYYNCLKYENKYTALNLEHTNNFVNPLVLVKEKGLYKICCWKRNLSSRPLFILTDCGETSKDKKIQTLLLKTV